jgi:rhodanese-related sulfurtransferase
MEEVLNACRHFLESIPDDLNYITSPQLIEILNRRPGEVFLLDNRTPEAYSRGHIPGAVNIWLKDVLKPENLEKLPKDKTIVVCCWVGHTASQLLACLQMLGFSAVGLKYGMGEPANPHEPRDGWLDLKYPIIMGRDPQ